MMLRSMAGLIFLAGFTGCDNEMPPHCTGPEVHSPDGQCFAYYYQTEFEGQMQTQALFLCDDGSGTKGGGNLVSYQNAISGGVGIKWASDNAIVLSIHPQAILYQDSVFTPFRVEFGSRIISISHEPLVPKSTGYAGCFGEGE